MYIIKDFKLQRGLTGIELVISIVILMIFITLISTVFFNIYLYFTESQRNAVASSYVTELAEMIDRMYYSEITEENLKEVINKMAIKDGYSLTASVRRYEPGEDAQDLVKTVTIIAEYKAGKQMKSIQIERIKAKEMLITPNKPKLTEGMVPVKYVTTDSVKGEGYWQITSETDSTWYSYENKRWANIMLEDGLTVEGGIKVTSDNKESLVGKRVETMGSMFVWIPRYAYKIPEENYHTGIAGEIDIIFLYSTSNNYVDENGNMQPISNMEGYKIHPSFQNGASTNYANGEWNAELTGFWVAKFEASSDNQEPSVYGGGNTSQLSVRSLPNKIGWHRINISNACIVCKAMTAPGNIYNLGTEANSHLMKNSEWGAVAYLTQSHYGNMQINSDNNSGVWNNGYHNGDSYYTIKTGYALGSRDSYTSINETSTTYYEYNTENGQKASTTRNIYGIYDMAGGSWEYTASFLTEGINTDINYLKTLPPYEKQEYSGNGTNRRSWKKRKFPSK